MNEHLVYYISMAFLKLIGFCALLAISFATPIPDSSRIVNGTRAEPGEIPYIISLRYDGSHTCGGSILDEWHILTAGHCVEDTTPDILTVQYGVLDIFTEDNVLGVEAIYQHEEYDPVTVINDVTVIKLSSPIIFDFNALPTILPFQCEPPPGNWPAVLAGWGLEKTGGSLQQYLQRVDLIIYTDEDCSAAHGPDVNPLYNVCAGIPEGGKGQCSGDSGGPLVVEGVQVGVVSWSVKPCTIKGYPGVFARVSSYSFWILSKMLLSKS